MSAALVLSETLTTSKHMTTGSFDNATNQSKKGILTDEQRDRINAKRRATYRRKKEEEAKKPDHENQAPDLNSGIHLDPMSAALVLSQTLTTSEHMTTGSFDNATNQSKKGILTDEQRDQINAKRRATYRRKKEEEAKKLDHHKLACGSTPDQSIIEKAAVYVDRQPTNGDLTFVARPSEMKTAGTRASSSTFLSLSGLTDELAADVSQSPNGITRYVLRCEPYLSYRVCVAAVH
ncbi:hypothetical protein ACQJBY_011067 [Aegilops geniculata]